MGFNSAFKGLKGRLAGLVVWSWGVRNMSIFTNKIRTFAATPNHFFCSAAEDGDFCF